MLPPLPPNLFILRQREGRKSRKQQLCECIALSVNFFTAYAQLRRKWLNLKLNLKFSWTAGDKFYCVFLSSDAVSSFISQPLKDWTIWN